MKQRLEPPFRADHVGSFLRPKYLLDAREQFFAKKAINAEQLRAVEDRAIAEIVKFQHDVGLQSITDGEFRRTYFHIDFLARLGGVKTDIPVTVLRPDGSEELAPPVIRVIGKVVAHKPAGMTLEQLCLSPQCGFSSTVHGNNIAVQAQRDKLQLVVEVAQEVWG